MSIYNRGVRDLKKTGLVYKKGEATEVVRVGLIVKRLRLIAKWLLGLSYVSLSGALIGVIWILLPWVSAEINYRLTVGKTQVYVPSSPTSEEKNTVEESLKPNWLVPDEDYSVFIPKIGAISKVVPQVDAGDASNYLASLKLGVAEAKGLASPGEVGTTYLFAHSVGNRLDYARYNAVFYLLDKLAAGDLVEVVYRQKLYQYQVDKVEIIKPNEVKYLIPQQDEEKLVLQTCYPPGTNWKRLIVVAKRV